MKTEKEIIQAIRDINSLNVVIEVGKHICHHTLKPILDTVANDYKVYPFDDSDVIVISKADAQEIKGKVGTAQYYLNEIQGLIKLELQKGI